MNNILGRSMNQQDQGQGHLDIGSEYNTAQWFNGVDNGQGILGQGGIEFPHSMFANLIVGEELQVPHRQGSVTVTGRVLQVVHMAIVEMHISHALYANNGEILETSLTPRFKDGFKSRLRLFGYMAEIESNQRMTPVVLTMKSTVAGLFKSLLRQFRNEVLNTVDRINGPGSKTSHYLFYIPFGSTGRVFYPDSRNPYTIAPPVPYWDSNITNLKPDDDLTPLTSLAIPDYLYDHIRTYGLDEGKKWKASLNETIETNGNNTPAAAAATDHTPPAPAAITKDQLDPWHETERSNNQPARHIPPPPAPPMPQAQAVASPPPPPPPPEPPMSDADAEKVFYEKITEAVKSGSISVAKIGDYTQSVNEAGWPAVLAQLQKDIEAA